MATTVVHDETGVEPLVDARPRTHLLGLDIGELCILGVALLLPIAFAVQNYATFFTLKAALLLLTIGPGLAVLTLGCFRRDRASWWAAAFLAVATLSTFLSDSAVLSVYGIYGWGNGLLFVAALAGFWAMGRTLGPRARELLVIVLIAGALVNAGWGWLQMCVDLVESVFLPYDGRAQGLMGNPVQLGALCAAAMWLAAGKTKDRLVPSLIALGVLAGAVQLSGSRIALIAGVGAIVYAAIRAGLRRGSLLAGAAAVGIVLAMFVPTTGDSSTQRVTGATSSGLAPRVALWQSGTEGMADRPLLGYGPGRFYVAATPHANVETARYTGGDVLYADAHNFIVEFGATTGVLGLLALGGFLVVTGRRARGPLVGFVIVAAITMLLQPMYVGLTPLVLLALGASGPRLVLFEPRDDSEHSPTRSQVGFVAICIATALVGAFAGYRAVAGDAAFERAVNQRSLSSVNRADELFPPWPSVPAQRGAIYATQRILTNNPALEVPATRSAREAMERDPLDPQWAFQLGNLEEASGHYATATRLYDRALELNPWSINALSGAYRLAVRADRDDDALEIRARLCEVGRSSCPPRPEKYRAQLQAQLQP